MIAKSKQTELEQSKLERRLNFMADAMPQLVWIANRDGEVEYFNQRWYDFTGLRPDQSKTKAWSEMIHPEDRKKVVTAWRKSVATGDDYEMQYRLYYAPDEAYRWVIGRAMAFKDDKGGASNWYGTCTDIDEQKHAAIVQTFLAKASKKLASSLNYVKTLKAVTELSVPHVADWCSIDLFDDSGELNQVAVSHADPDKVLQVVAYRERLPVDLDSNNGLGRAIRSKEAQFYPHLDKETIRTITGNKQEYEFVSGLNLQSMIIAPIIDRDEVIGAISFVMSESGRYFRSEDVIMADKIASRVALAIANSSLYEASLREIRARKKLERELIAERQKLESRVIERTKQLNLTNQGLVDEIRRREEAEEELKAYSEELSRSNQELEDFAYVASHDLQEPLRKIQAFGGLLKSEYGDKLGEASDYLDRMLNASSRMSNLIHDLLSFSRVSTQDNLYVEVDLNSIVAEVLIDLEAAIDQVEGKVEITKLPKISADPTHMRQLFQNLIGNALKFHRPNIPPVVYVSSRNVGRGEVEVMVQDNGIGFDNKYSEKIFSVFQRLHGRSSYQGTGIGLAVCRKIVQHYDGTITVDSVPGEGSRFVIRLPKKFTKETSDDQ